MPSLNVEEQARLDTHNVVSTWRCETCEQKHSKRYCGRCDMVYYVCGCPYVSTGGPYDRDHEKCR
jgi:hypothetical protein